MKNNGVLSVIIMNVFFCGSSFSGKQPHAIPGYAAVQIDPQRVQLLGIITEKVSIKNLKKTIRTVGIVEVDERLISTIQTKFTGWIEKLYVNFTGIPVKKGQPLFTVYSQDLFATQQEYLLALKDLEHPISGRFAQELKKASEELLQAARKRFALWDISDEQIKILEQTGQATKTLTMYSPVNGIVLKKNAFVGMNVEPGMELFAVADLSHVWILADVYENDMSLVKVGQKAQIIIPALPQHTITAEATYVSYVVETSTRTAKVRFESDNTDFLLKPGMYTRVDIDIPLGPSLAVKDEAVIDTGKRKIVFVAKGNGHFEPRDVRLGYKANSYYQVLDGLEEGEDVVLSSQFLLDSESRITALETKDMKEH